MSMPMHKKQLNRIRYLVGKYHFQGSLTVDELEELCNLMREPFSKWKAHMSMEDIMLHAELIIAANDLLYEIAKKYGGVLLDKLDEMKENE